MRFSVFGIDEDERNISTGVAELKLSDLGIFVRPFNAWLYLQDMKKVRVFSWSILPLYTDLESWKDGLSFRIIAGFVTIVLSCKGKSPCKIFLTSGAKITCCISIFHAFLQARISESPVLSLLFSKNESVVPRAMKENLRTVSPTQLFFSLVCSLVEQED